MLSDGAPFVDERDLCSGFTDDRHLYNQGSCNLAAVYQGDDAVYRVRLNSAAGLDNRVRFRLEPLSPDADLVLALVRACGSETACEVHSPDFIGPGIEEIPLQTYPAGVYHLFVDSATSQPAGRCGRYRLTVSGVNPTPDLRVELTASPDPVVAGTDLDYVLTVVNDGTLPAAETEAVVRLPVGTELESVPGACAPRDRRTLFCRLGEIPARGGSRTLPPIRVRVDPATRGTLRASAEAEAREGAQDRDQCRTGDGEPRHCASVATAVTAEVDLTVRATPEPVPVVAGCTLLHRIVVANQGPSDATGVEVIFVPDRRVDASGALDPGTGCPAAPVPPEGCATSLCRPAPGARGTLRCPLGRLAPGGAPVSLCVPRTVRSSAGDPAGGTALLRNVVRATGAPDEREREPSDNVAVTRPPVVRQTDLSVTKVALAETVGGQSDELGYRVTVSNHGPSDSAGAIVDDPLPDELSPRLPLEEPCSFDRSARRIVCETGPLPVGTEEAVEFAVLLDQESVEPVVVNQASVRPARDGSDPDPDDNLSDRVETPVELVDLGLTKTAFPEEVPAGGNVRYRLTVSNAGPFDSHGGRVVGRLPEGLVFVSSPDGCFVEMNDDGAPRVECPFGGIEVGGEIALRWVGRVPSNVTEGPLENTAEIESRHDPGPGDDEASATITIIRSADLAVEKVAGDDPVGTGKETVHVVRVTNRGPSDATVVTVCDRLSDGASFGDPLPMECALDTGGGPCPLIPDLAGPGLACTIGPLRAGEHRELAVAVVAPPDRGTLRNRATVFSGVEPDPVAENDTADALVTVGDPDDRDLAISIEGSADPAIVGEPLVYLVSVENHGPGTDAVDAELRIGLAPEVDVLEIGAPEACGEATPGRVRCEVPDLEPDGVRTFGITVRVRESPAGGVLPAKAEVSGAAGGFGPPTDPDEPCPAPGPPVPGDPDPNRANDCATEETRVVAAPALVLPYFEADAAPSGAAALFAVRNLGEEAATLTFEYDAPDGEPRFEDEALLEPGAYRTVNLRDVGELFAGAATASGSVGVDGAGEVAGDFLRVDPGERSASGGALLSTGSAGGPPELCRRWAVRFLNGGPIDGGTELVFWRPESADPATASLEGRVYTESGDFVQTLTIATRDTAFARPTGAGFDGGSLGPGLLADFGVIEWDFLGGVGNVSSVHRAEGRFAIGVPGVCLDRRASRRGPLVLPHFEVEGGPAGRSTLLAVRNDGETPTAVRLSYLDPEGRALIPPEEVDLPARAVHTVNLRDRLPGDGSEPPEPLTGFVAIEATPPDPAPLSGDFFRIDPADDLAAGGALIDAGPSAVPPRVCQGWVTRLIHGGAFDGGTELLFWTSEAEDGASATFRGILVDEAGTELASFELDRESRSFRLESGAAPLEGIEAGTFGAIEWTFPAGRAGHVSSLLRAEGRYSVLLPGVCIEPAEP